MPQIRLEGSPVLLDTVDIQTMLTEVHAAIVRIAAAKLADCKTLVLDARSDRIGDTPATEAMLHLEIRLLPGRDLATKQALGAAVTEIMAAAAKPHQNGRTVQVTAEILEFARETYAKQVLPA